jgi:hypothetical protein
VVRGPRRKGCFHLLIPKLGQRGQGREAYSDQSRDFPHLFSGDGSPNVGPRAVPNVGQNLKSDSNLKLSQVSKASTRGGRNAPMASPLPVVRGPRRKGGVHRRIPGLGQRWPDRESCSDRPRDSPHLFGGDGSPNVGPRAVPKNAESQSQSAYQKHDAQESAEGDPARPCSGTRGPTSA